MVRAGLGLGLHDTLYGSDYVRVYDAWWEYMRTHYYPIRDGELVGPTTAYYDPLLSIHQPGDHEPFFKLFIAKCALPRFPEDARVLFESAARYLNWRTGRPLEEPDDQSAGSLGAFELHYGLFFARETGDQALYAKLKAYSEAHHEPTWNEATSEFYWGFGLNEPHPRGQLNGAASMAEAVTEGAWQRLISTPNLRKFVEPTVYDVDFPRVCLSQASYDVERRALVIATDEGLSSDAGNPTRFRVTNVEPARCSVEIDGARSEDWHEVDGDIEVSTTVGRHTIVVRI